jgi:hypothetical protein
MTTPSLGQWGEWRRLCAIARCAEPTAAALAGFARAKFRHYAAPIVGEEAVATEIPDAAACFNIVEHWMSVARPVSGRRYKEWLFARTRGQSGRQRLSTLLAGASLVVRSVVRKWLADERRPEELSLDAPVPGLEGVTFVDLIPDENAMAVEETLLRDLADSLADEIFGGMTRPTRLVMLARAARLPLYHPLLLGEFGFGKTKAADTWKEVLQEIARRIKRRWPDEPADWKVGLAMRTSDAIDRLLQVYDEGGRIRAHLTQLAGA